MRNTRQPSDVRTPAEPGLWLFAWGDLLLFGFLFAVHYGYRAQSPEVFAAGQAELSPGHGVVYTLLLLTSSLLVAAAVTGRRTQSPRRGVLLIDGAALCGAMFAGLKVLEYVHLGPLASADNFWIMYFALTGMHLGHVGIGLGALAAMRNLLKRPGLDERQTRMLESCGVFWHLVDALWVILFSMLFLTR